MSISPKIAEALAVDVAFSADTLTVVLSDGRIVSVPVAWFPRLIEATPRQRAGWELIGGGIGIHWEDVDEDISIASLLQPENFMRLSPVPLRTPRKKQRVKLRERRARG